MRGEHLDRHLNGGQQGCGSRGVSGGCMLDSSMARSSTAAKLMPAYQISRRDDPLGHLVEAGRRIGHAALDIVVGDQLLVVAVRQSRRPGRPAAPASWDRARSHRRSRRTRLCRARTARRRPGDAPLHGTVDVVFGLGLCGVEGLQRVRVVVAEHARAIDRRRPVLQGSASTRC